MAWLGVRPIGSQMVRRIRGLIGFMAQVSEVYLELLALGLSGVENP
jgi:hypothetical protein